MECRARGPAVAAGYTAGPGALYKNLLVSDAILSLSLGSALGAVVAAAALGGRKHRRSVRSPPGSQRRGHRRERGGGGGGGGRETRKERKTDRTGIGRAAAAAGARGDPALFPSSNDL